MASKVSDVFLKKQNTEPSRRSDRRVQTLNVILALALAVILWAYVIGEVNPETERTISDVPLRIVGENVLESNGLALLTEFEDTVTVVISGRRSDVYNINAGNLSAKIDVSGCVEGENQISVQVSAPDKVSKAEARDGDFLVLVDKVVTVEKPVEIQVSGKLSRDTSVEITSLDEETLEVTGPSTYVEQVEVLSGVLNVSDAVNDYSRSVAVHPVDKEGKPVERVELSQSNVTVEAEKLLIKNVILEVATTGSPPQGMTVAPTSNLKLKIRGHYDDVNSITSLKTSSVDISDMTENTSREVTVQLPEGVIALDSSGNALKNQENGTVVIKVDFVVRSEAEEAPAETGTDTETEPAGNGSSDNAETNTDAGGETGSENEQKETEGE